MSIQTLNEEAGNEDDSITLLLPDLTSVMKVELLINNDGDVWILHDKPFNGILHWVEFDEIFRSVTLVMRDGHTQDLGLNINDDMAKRLIDGKMIFTILTNKDKIKDMYMVPIVVRT